MDWPAVAARREPPAGPRARHWAVAAAALVLAAAAAVIATARDVGPGPRALEARPSLKQMLDESRRLEQEGSTHPTYALPAAQRHRNGVLAERATSGPHALDWRKGDRDPETPAAPSPREYSPPPGPIERVDDPVGDKDGWVRMGDRAFRVTRSRSRHPHPPC